MRWSPPRRPASTARCAPAEWADGIATASQPPAALRRVLDAYRGSGGGGPAILQVHVSLAPTDAEALSIVRDQWRHALLAPPALWDLERPEDFDDAIGEPDDARLRDAVLLDTDPRSLAERIAELCLIGFDRVYLHHVGAHQSGFLAAAASDIIPRLKELL